MNDEYDLSPLPIDRDNPKKDPKKDEKEGGKIPPDDPWPPPTPLAIDS